MVIYVVIFGTGLAVLTTAVQVFFDYRNEVDAIHGRMDLIRGSYLEMMAVSLWTFDETQIQIELEGLMALPDIKYVQVETSFGKRFERGTVPQRASLTRSFPLDHKDSAGVARLGRLRVDAGLEGVYHRLSERFLLILVTNAAKTFFTAIFILFIFQRFVTKHLGTMAAYARRLDLLNLDQPLTLDRAKSRHDQADELDEVTAALNNMRLSLQKGIDERNRAENEIRTLNASLEERVRERTSELRVRAAELEAVNRELASFGYSVSHDLRTPLRSIDGFSHILLEDYADKLDAEGQENLQTIRRATQRMGQLIDDMLMLSKLTRQEFRHSPVNLSALATAVADELKQANPERNGDFVIQPGLIADADANLMRIVFENLLGNAWKFTGREATARIEFGRTQQDDGTFYFVRDNGVGFDANGARMLFRPFQRLHHAAEFPGTGIGLATVQRCLDRHGGRIWAESAVGQGATFYFTLTGGSPLREE